MIRLAGLVKNKLTKVFYLSALLFLLSACGGLVESQPSEIDRDLTPGSDPLIKLD